MIDVILMLLMASNPQPCNGPQCAVVRQRTITRTTVCDCQPCRCGKAKAKFKKKTKCRC